MPLAARLIAAYRAAHYAVYGEPELVIRIGEPNADLEALLEAEGTTTATFVTAANPRGERRSDNENAMAFESLKKWLNEKRYRYRTGAGRDPEGAWSPEASVLITCIARADAVALGRRLEQNAIVFIEKGGAPELLLLA